MEEEAAEFIENSVNKPVVTMIVGRAAPVGKSLGHAGAIIEGNKGTAAAKLELLQKAGARVASSPREIIQIIKQIRGE